MKSLRPKSLYRNLLSIWRNSEYVYSTNIWEIASHSLQVDQTRANLEASRDAFDKSADRLVKGQQEIASTISKLTHWELEKATLDSILPMLGRAVKSFASTFAPFTFSVDHRNSTDATALRAQFAQMTLFFSKLVSLINDVMRPQIEGFVNKMEKGAALMLGDIKYTGEHALR